MERVTKAMGFILNLSLGKTSWFNSQYTAANQMPSLAVEVQPLAVQPAKNVVAHKVAKVNKKKTFEAGIALTFNVQMLVVLS